MSMHKMALAFWIGVIDVEGRSELRYASLISEDAHWWNHCAYIEGRRLRRVFYRRRL